MSHYSAYITELTNKSILETDIGFAVYSIDGQSCYIEDIYIAPHQRNSLKASELANKITEIAREKGCNKLFGSVIPSAKHSTRSLQVLLGYGMQLDSSTNNFILFSKEI